MNQRLHKHVLIIGCPLHGFRTDFKLHPDFFESVFCKILFEYPDFLQNFLKLRNKITVFLNLPGFLEKNHGQPM